MSRIIIIPAAALIAAAFCTPGARGETLPASPEVAQPEQLRALREENELLRGKIRELGARPLLTPESLAARNLGMLRQLARDVQAERQAMGGFQSFVTWMTENLNGHARYIQAGSIAAGFAKVLPIPYAGQASVLAKFVSQGVLALNTASAAMKKYLDSSQRFVTGVETLDPARPSFPACHASPNTSC